MDTNREKLEYWSEPGAGERYHKAVNSKYGIQLIKNMVEKDFVNKWVIEKGIVLDAGCGTGRFTRLCARNRNKVIAFDGSNEMLMKNKAISESNNIKNIEYIKGDLRKINLPDEYVDMVVSITVLRHFGNIEKVLSEYKRVTSKNGIIIIELPNSNVESLDLNEKVKNYYNKENFLKENEYEKIFKNLGLKIIEKKYYDFLNYNKYIKYRFGSFVSKYFFGIITRLLTNNYLRKKTNEFLEKRSERFKKEKYPNILYALKREHKNS